MNDVHDNQDLFPLEEINTADEIVRSHIIATPLVEILSITMESHPDYADKSRIFEIFGKIRLLDTRHFDGDGDGDGDGGEDEIFSFFDKAQDNPEFIKLGDPLVLTTPSPTPVIAPSKDIKLDVLLYDRKSNNSVVASGAVVLDKVGDQCEAYRMKKIGDPNTFALVKYAVFQYAVAATVDVLYLSKGGNFDVDETLISDDARNCGDTVFADVCGTITAHHSSFGNGNGKTVHPVLLFKTPPKQFMPVKFGVFIQLSRSLVVVPAYCSSLVIDLDLYEREGDTVKQIATGNLEFMPIHKYIFYKDLVGKNGACVRVRVEWNQSACQERYRAFLEDKLPAIRKGIKAKNSCRIPLLEVFSVLVYSKDFKHFSFYGTINLDNFEVYPMFSKSKNCPQICPESGAVATLIASYPYSVRAWGFLRIVVNLKDAETEAEISNNSVLWDDVIIPPWHDERICSIVCGEHGFAAVHYTMFFDGISANLDFKLNGNYLPGYVYGKIIARYSTYEYSTAYDKKCYQIILFDSDSGECVSQEAYACGSNLLLLRPVVCMAQDSSLIVDAELIVSSKPLIGGKFAEGAELLQDCVDLQYDGDDESRGQIGNEDFYIDIHVKWRV